MHIFKTVKIIKSVRLSDRVVGEWPKHHQNCLVCTSLYFYMCNRKSGTFGTSEFVFCVLCCSIWGALLSYEWSHFHLTGHMTSAMSSATASIIIVHLEVASRSLVMALLIVEVMWPWKWPPFWSAIALIPLVPVSMPCAESFIIGPTLWVWWTPYLCAVLEQNKVC